jgi:hypothetical protein
MSVPWLRVRLSVTVSVCGGRIRLVQKLRLLHHAGDGGLEHQEDATYLAPLLRKIESWPTATRVSTGKGRARGD